VFEPGKPISDPNILKEMLQGAFKINPKFNYSGHEVFIAGDIALHFAPWTMKGKTPDGSRHRAKRVISHRTTSTGKW